MRDEKMNKSSVVRLVSLLFITACGDGQEVPVPMEVGSEAGAVLPDLVFARGNSDFTRSDLFGYRFDDQSTSRITQTATMEEFPTWSRDGSRIAFLVIDRLDTESEDEEFSTRIDEIDLLSGNRRVLVQDIGEPVSWSRDSSEIVVTMDQADLRGIAIVDLGDGSVRPVITESGGGAYATWSPAADQLAYESGSDGDPEIFVAHIDGSEERQLTYNDVLDEWPQWSNDGTRIAYASGEEGDKHLWVMNADGSNKRQLTNNVLFGDAYPAWSPDDSQIVLTAMRDGGAPTLFLVDVTSGGLTELFEGMAASWRPK